MKQHSDAFGKRLRQLRRARQLGMKELARRVDVDPSFLSRVERGLVSAPRVLVLRVAALLGVDAEPLLLQAGHLPEDVRTMLAEHPRQVLEVLRRSIPNRSASRAVEP